MCFNYILLLKWKCLEGQGVFVYMMTYHFGMVSELITTMFLTLDSHSSPLTISNNNNYHIS